MLPPPPSRSPGGDTGNCIKVSAETSTAIYLGQLDGEECAARLTSREDPLTQLYEVSQLGNLSAVE